MHYSSGAVIATSTCTKHRIPILKVIVSHLDYIWIAIMEDMYSYYEKAILLHISVEFQNYMKV